MLSQSTLMTLKSGKNITYSIILSSNTESNGSSNDKISNYFKNNGNDNFNISNERSEDLQNRYMK